MPPERHVDRPWDGKRESRRRGQLVAELASRQHGVVARWQLREIGYGADAIDGWIARSGLIAIYRGIYAVGRRPLTETGRCMAAVLAGGDNAALSDRPASWVWDLDDSLGGPLHVAVPSNRRSRIGLVFHRRHLPPDERTVQAGIPITTVARTLFDAAATQSPTRLRHMIALAEIRHLADTPSLPELMERYKGAQGMARLRAVMGSIAAEGVANRELELRFADFLAEWRIPPPQKNVPITVSDGRTLTVDCFWPDAALVVELDSRRHHADWEAAETDRARDAALIAIGLRSMRVTWRRLHQERAQLAQQLLTAIAAVHIDRP
jgi:hypothetical protein